jgi:lipoprotein NlpD
MTPARPLLLICLCSLALSACAQSRVVRYDGPRQSQDVSGARVTTQPVRVPMSPEERPERVQVRPGDTLYGISFRHGLDYREVAAWNGIREPYTIQLGQSILLRPPEGWSATPVAANAGAPAAGTAASAAGTAPTTSASAEPPATSGAASTDGPATIGPVAAANPPAASDAPPASTNAAPVAVQPIAGVPPSPEASSAPPAATVSADGWRWPTDGNLLSRFAAGDPTRAGINIGGRAGQDVVAARDGVVVYSGAGLVGYGELIIVKHSDEWLTAYAHNRRRLVAEGEQVRAGQPIAELGRTGTTRDMLHFEVRRNGRPVDPLEFLPQR